MERNAQHSFKKEKWRMVNNGGRLMRTIRAALVIKQTSDGLMRMRDDVPLGTEYRVYPDSISVLDVGDPGTSRSARCLCIFAEGKDDCGYLPVELLRIDG